MEIDENLKYTFLQFDPCPRAGEPMVSRRKFYHLHSFPHNCVANVSRHQVPRIISCRSLSGERYLAHRRRTSSSSDSLCVAWLIGHWQSLASVFLFSFLSVEKRKKLCMNVSVLCLSRVCCV